MFQLHFIRGQPHFALLGQMESMLSLTVEKFVQVAKIIKDIGFYNYKGTPIPILSYLNFEAWLPTNNYSSR